MTTPTAPSWPTPPDLSHIWAVETGGLLCGMDAKENPYGYGRLYWLQRPPMDATCPDCLLEHFRRSQLERTA